MMYPATVAVLIALTACYAGSPGTNTSTVYLDRMTGCWVSYGRGAPVGPPRDHDSGEPGEVNPAVIEHIFAVPESPFTRYYDLVLSLTERPRAVDVELAALDAEARRGLGMGAVPRGHHYARALGRKLAYPILAALLVERTRFQGVASVHWGIPVDLDAGIPLLEYESSGATANQTALLRYQHVGLLVLHSSATRQMLVWDVSNLPGAFQWGVPLEPSTVAARILPLHPREL